jgi:tetratricopeptide (TPR) repeat protein
MADQRVLLVLDNAASSAQVTPLLPGGEDCLVLVTSRRHLGDLPGVVVPVLLDALPPDQAQKMFLALAPRAGTTPDAAVHELVGLAGCLPLAISLLARVYARHPTWTLADLTRETKASLLTLAAEKDSVAAAFGVSYRCLASGQQEFFRRLGLHPGTTTDAYAGAALAGIPLQDAARYLDALHGEGLLTEAGYRRYGMHDLIRRYSRDLATANPADNRDRGLEHLLDYYQQTAELAEALLTRQSRTKAVPGALTAPPIAVPSLPDRTRALSWARAERGNLLACLDHVARTGHHARVASLTVAIAALLRQDGPWTDAITRHAAAVQATRHLGDRMGEADALSNLGDVRQLTGDYPGATGALEEALRIYRDLGDQGGEVEVVNEVGALHRVRGDLEQAEACHRQALDLAREIGSPWDEAHGLAGLGRCALAAGHTAGAEAGLRQALEIFQRIGGAEAAGLAAELDALTEKGPAP